MTRQHAPSRLLLPMCHAASLGGTLTLVGTPTNLLVNSLMAGRGMPLLQIFDLFPVGLAIVVGCGITMFATYPTILKAQPPGDEAESDCFLETTVLPESKLVGQTVEANGLRKFAHLFLTEIVRDGRVIAPVEPDTLTRAGDLLGFSGDITRLNLLLQFDGLVTTASITNCRWTTWWRSSSRRTRLWHGALSRKWTSGRSSTPR